MAIYWEKSAQELKEFVEGENVCMGAPSGKNGKPLKNNYLTAKKNWLESLPPKCIIPCEWLLVGLIKLCGRPSLPGGNFCALHKGRIHSGKPQTVECVKCKRGTKKNDYVLDVI